MVSFAVSLGNQVTSQGIETLPLHEGLCRGRPNTSLATRGLTMEKLNLNRSVCEELFGGEMDVTEKVPDLFENDKS